MKKDLHKNICQDSIFKGLYERLANDLHDFLYYKYGGKLSPSDKVQEAFIKLWENCKNITPGKAKSYLYTVANNLMLNEVKHQKVVLKYQHENPKTPTSESPEFLLEKQEYFKKYQEVLASLTEEQRIAFLLNKAEGKRHEEIAQILGVTRKVVEYRIYSAFKVLKAELEGFNIK
ncbi:RNA polymerase sigma factor [Muriicola sp. Z0-33]|uniref:RNA polymerase sigma factor n=1 Tax=Muriicola sp. Z0-33 TaxID=2816957 RepID=UPI002238C843|nr:RNA polymerase sigma factor [Muriicola sp. Z0-33]MCW5515724.1 RNA polymerase sigma factor [Muriicola sp. Z0-33]